MNDPDPLFGAADAANTPLTAEERDGLILTHVTLRHELDEAEQANIMEARRWLAVRRRNLLDRLVLSELHRRMFRSVWQWAGVYRTTPRNIGVDAYRIGMEVQQAVDDARYRIANQTFSPDEIAIRFSHRLVAIHPFPNGNGRFSRLVGDTLVQQLGHPAFTWGRSSLVEMGATREAYVAALQAADGHDWDPLLRFARS